MSKIGKRIKSVILKGKTFWNWKKEDDINVNIPVPKDYRNKVSYETNVEFIFNREVIASFSYNDPSQIPSMDDLIPAGYKLLYDNENTIQPYNNNRYILVYDYYDLIVHYRNASDPNTDIKVYKGRYQYGTLITANMIDWPAGKNGKEEWIEFPIGELTPARVTDKYVYFTNGSSSSISELPVSESMNLPTTIQLTVDESDKDFESLSRITVPPGYIDDVYLQKYIKGRLPLGVYPNSDFSVDIRKGSVNNIDITSKTRRIPETPQAYYVGRNVDIRTTQYMADDGSTRTRFEIAPIIWYDEDDPAFAVFKSNNINDLKTFFDNHITRMRNEYISGGRIPGGTYAAPFNSSTKMINILANSYKIFEIPGMPPFIYMMNRAMFNFAEERYYPFTPAVFNIGEALNDFESNGWPRIVDYYKNRKFTINTDVVNKNFKYKRIENFSYDGKTADLCVYLVPLKRIKYIGLYLGDKNGNMYKNYFSNMSNGNPVISNDLMNDMYGKTINMNNMIHEGLKRTTYRELKDATGKSGYDQFKTADGDRFSLSSNYTTKYIHSHKPSETNATQLYNLSNIGPLATIDETSILVEHKRNTINIADDVTQKYRIHFFDETGSEMKHYYTDQIIKEGTPPSPYPPRGYIVDPNKPWTRNPDNNKEIYVYLKKKICRVIVKATVSNPSNIKNKYWNAILGDNILLDTNKYVGEKINPATLFEGFKNTHSAKLKSVQIEDSAYNSMTELEIEDSVTITFNFKVTKQDSYISNLKLSAARESFKKINPYFDYCLTTVLLPKDQLTPDNAPGDTLERTQTNITLRPGAGLETTWDGYIVSLPIIYDKQAYATVPDLIVPKVEIWKIKEGVKSLKETLLNFNVKTLLGSNAIGAEKIGTGTTNFVNKKIASNIAKYLVDDMNNTVWSDQFSYVYANSPEVVNSGVDIEIVIEWPDEVHSYTHNGNMVVDVKLIPTALLPIIDERTVYTDDEIKENLTIKGTDATTEEYIQLNFSYGMYTYIDPFARKIATKDLCTKIKRGLTNDEYKKCYPATIEAIRVFGNTVISETLGFLYRPYAIYQILSHPIPIITDVNVGGFSGNNPFLADNVDYMHRMSYTSDDTLTQINKNKLENITPELVSMTYKKAINPELCADNLMVPIFWPHERLYSALATRIMYNGERVFLFPSMIVKVNPEIDNDYYDVGDEIFMCFGARSIEEWFKVLTMSGNTKEVLKVNCMQDLITRQAGGGRRYRISKTPYRPSQDPLKYIPVSLHLGEYSPSYTEIEYNGTDYMALNIISVEAYEKGQNGYAIDNNMTFGLAEANICVKKYEDKDTIRTIYWEKNDIYNPEDVLEINSPYRGYLKGIPIFKNYIRDEITCIAGYQYSKDFRIISGGLYERISNAVGGTYSNAANRDFKVPDLVSKFSNLEGIKEMIARGEIDMTFTGEADMFSDESVIDCIITNDNMSFIGKLKDIKWHLLKHGDNIVLDFDRKYGLSVGTEYSRTWIIPDLDKRFNYRYDYNQYKKMYINDSSTWTVPFFATFDYGMNGNDAHYHAGYIGLKHLTRYVGLDKSTNSRKTVGNYEFLGNEDRTLVESVWYSLLMFDIMNNPYYDDPYASKVDVINKNKVVKYKYKRYPNNNEIDKYVNIHMYNQTTVDDVVNLTANRFDYRFDPAHINSRIYGASLYEVAMKLTNIYDFFDNIRMLLQDTNRIDNRILLSMRSSRTNTWYTVNDSNEYDARGLVQNNILDASGKTYRIIHPNIVTEFSMNETYRPHGVYNPVLNKTDTINGIGRDTPNVPVGSFGHGLWNQYTDEQIPWKRAYNPYTYMRYNDGTSTGVTYEDIFRKAWDPYTGYRAFGIVKKYDPYNRRMINNFGFSYDDPRFLQAFWFHRTAKAYEVGAFSQNHPYHKELPNPSPNNMWEHYAPTNYFTVQDAVYIPENRTTNLTRSNNKYYSLEVKGAHIFHPMDLRHLAHPLQRSAFLTVHLIWSGLDAPNQNTYGTPNSIIYAGYVNFNTFEIDKRKYDKDLLRSYIAECMLRENSGYRSFFNDLRYKWITSATKWYDYRLTNILDSLVIEYEEHFDDSNPYYEFRVRSYIKVEIFNSGALDFSNDHHQNVRNYKSIPADGGKATAISAYMGAVARRSNASPNCSLAEYLEACKRLSSIHVVKSEANPETDTPVIYSNKYSVFSVEENGWSSFDGQWLPKWPAVIPDAILLKSGQYNFTVNKSNTKFDNVKPGTLFTFFSTMVHPYYCGWRDSKIKAVENVKFYGSVDFTMEDPSRPITDEKDPNVSFSGLYRNAIERSSCKRTIFSGLTRWAQGIIGWGNITIFNNTNKSNILRNSTRQAIYFKSTQNAAETSFKATFKYTIDQAGLDNDNTKSMVMNIRNVDWNSPNGVYVDINPAAIAIVTPTNRREYEPQAWYWNFARFDIRDYGADYFNNASKWSYVDNGQADFDLAFGINENDNPGRFTEGLTFGDRLS